MGITSLRLWAHFAVFTASTFTVLHAEEAYRKSANAMELLRQPLLDSWQQRQAGVHSIEVEAQIEHRIAGRRDRRPESPQGVRRPEMDPFSDPHPVEDRVLRIHLHFAKQGEKIALSTVAEQISHRDPE